MSELNLAPALPLIDAAPNAPGAFPGLWERVNALCDENELLGRELLRCYDQLNLVFQITDHIANLDDPACIEQSLLKRWGAMLGVSAVYEDVGDACTVLAVPEVDAPAPDLAPADVALALDQEIRRTRERRRTVIPELSAETAERLRGAHVLLATLPRLEEPGCVAVALRPADQQPFDTRDVLASESALGYGGQVLSNLQMMRRLQHAAFETVGALAAAIDAKDPYTCGHSHRVGYLARLLGGALELAPTQLQTLEWGGLLHDVGKIGIPEAILHKQGRLTPEEYDVIKRHPRLSHDVLRPVAALCPILPAVLHHHENHDGSGYPDGLAGDAIPVEARVIHVVDIFDALTSDRSYRARFGFEQAIDILLEDAGRVTDPELTDVFVRFIRARFADADADLLARFAHLYDAVPASANAD